MSDKLLTQRPVGHLKESLTKHVIRPTSVPEPSFISSISELMQEVLPPQGRSAPSEREKVQWVAFERAPGDLTDERNGSVLDADSCHRSQMLIYVGLRKGYQIWCLNANNDCEQLICDRTMPVRLLQVLPSPLPCFDGAESDSFESSRPLVAACEATSSGENPTWHESGSVSFASLRTGKSISTHSFKHPVLDLQANRKIVLVIAGNQLHVLDANTLKHRQLIDAQCPLEDYPTPPAAHLGDSTWLAYATTSLNEYARSRGGSQSADTASVAAHVMTAAKTLGKGVTAISETVLGPSKSGAHQISPASSPRVKANGVVSIVDLAKGNVDADGLLLHFVALLNERVYSMRLSRDATLLAASGTKGHTVNIFKLYPAGLSQPVSASYVQHLYVLARGATPARVHDLTFSSDCRWLSATSNHGTTHVFAIAPYGGPVSMRTHGGPHLVNKESGFMKSAGFTEQRRSPKNSPAGSPAQSELHLPSIGTDAPTVLYAASKVHQQLTASNLSTRAADIGATTEVAQPGDVNTRARFGKPTTNARVPLNYNQSLYIVNSEGQLTEYAVVVTAGQSGTKYQAEASISLTLHPVQQWEMHRTRGTPDCRPPFTNEENILLRSSSLVAAASEASVRARAGAANDQRKSSAQKHWLAQIEMRTYSGPARRIWLGPQFTFMTYGEPEMLNAPESAGDTDSNNESKSGNGNGGKKKNKKKNAAATSQSTTTAVPKSEPIRMPSRALPVHVIDDVARSDTSRMSRVEVVCGSWSDNDYISCDEHDTQVRQSIADAMSDAHLTTNQGSDGTPMEDARSSFSESSADSTPEGDYK